MRLKAIFRAAISKMHSPPDIAGQKILDHGKKNGSFKAMNPEGLPNLQDNVTDDLAAAAGPQSATHPCPVEGF